MGIAPMRAFEYDSCSGHGGREQETSMSSTAERRHTVLLDPDASDELEADARAEGMELQDHMASILTRHVLARLAKRKPEVAERLAAEARIKAAAAAISREEAAANGVRTDHTVVVFRRIRERHREDYLRATGCITGFETGMPRKHSLNAALGAISKRAAAAKVRKNAAGEPEKIRNIRGEFCRTATALEPGNGVDDEGGRE